MSEVIGAEALMPMIITPAHKHQPMNADKVCSVLGIEQVGWTTGKFLRLAQKILTTGDRGAKIPPRLLRVDTAASNWYLLERIDGHWLLKSGTGGLPKGITFTEIRDGQLYTEDG